MFLWKTLPEYTASWSALLVMVHDSWGLMNMGIGPAIGLNFMPWLRVHCRMAVAFRPLSPCLNLLLHRSNSFYRHACLRIGSAQVPIRCKIKHAFRADSSKSRPRSRGSAPRASSSDDVEQVLGLARQAIPQTFAPHSVVCSLTSTQH